VTAILATLVLGCAALLALVQAGSDAIFSGAAAPGSLPARLQPQTGVSIYRAIARFSPAPYVIGMLESAAFTSGDLDAAHAYALRLPASGRREDDLGRIALARGQTKIALQHFVAAQDSAAVDAYVIQTWKADPPAAYALERDLKDQLSASGTHPDALALAYWRMGTLAIALHRPRLSLNDFEQAVHISPLSERFLIWAGFEAYDLHRLDTAAGYFDRAVAADPTSADAYAGAGLVALARGDRATAFSDRARAKALNPHSMGLHTLQEALR